MAILDSLRFGIERSRLRRRRGSDDRRCTLKTGIVLDGAVRRTSDAITGSGSLTPGFCARELELSHGQRDDELRLRHERQSYRAFRNLGDTTTYAYDAMNRIASEMDTTPHNDILLRRKRQCHFRQRNQRKHDDLQL